PIPSWGSADTSNFSIRCGRGQMQERPPARAGVRVENSFEEPRQEGSKRLGDRGGRETINGEHLTGPTARVSRRNNSFVFFGLRPSLEMQANQGLGRRAMEA